MNRTHRCYARARANIEAIRILDWLDLGKIPAGSCGPPRMDLAVINQASCLRYAGT